MIEPAETIRYANSALGLAAELVRHQKAFLEQFLAEAKLMDSAGPVLAPELFRSEDRRIASEVLVPFYQAALEFLEIYESHGARVTQAVNKVKPQK